MIEKFKADRDPAGYNVARIDASLEKDGGKIMSEILAIPFWPSGAFFIAIESLLEQSSQNFKKRCWSASRANATNPILSCFGKPRTRLKPKTQRHYLNVWQKKNVLQAFEEDIRGLDDELIQTEIKERGGRIAPDALVYLCRPMPGAIHGLCKPLIDAVGGLCNGGAP